MSSVRVQLDGLEAVLSNVDITQKQLNNKISAIVQGAGLKCQKQAKIACPVDTGRLRNSILYHKIDAYSCRVDTNVSYAPFVEFGTRHMSSRPFLYPAYVQAKADMMEKLRNV